MPLWPRRYRSAGVRVSAATHRLIGAGNRARDAGDWEGAARFYAKVLDDRPDLTHIRVQRGHALKEQDRWSDAEREYRGAHDLSPADRDAALHLARAWTKLGSEVDAAKLYVALVARDPDDEEAMREARHLLGRLEPVARGALAARLGAMLSASVEGTAAHPPASASPVVFDASDLISFFSHSRRPTGIQRVQIEVLSRALIAGDGAKAVAVCCFIDGRDCWVEVPSAALLRLMRLSGAPGGADDRDWRGLRDALHLNLLVSEPLAFAAGATLINLGTSWWLHNYFLHLRNAQARAGIHYVPMIHDMIPLVLPELCLKPLVRDFVAWASGIFDHTSTFLANSEATKRDLIAGAALLGHVVAPGNVVVVPLDAAPQPGTDPTGCVPTTVGDRPFVLLVATIEPRKGHLIAFDAWAKLIAGMGTNAAPRLVCVGRSGWGNRAVFDRLESDSVLRRHVTLLADIDEATLDALYRRCLFVVYPSLYEGWGLPVTEALGRGKAVITTTSSSLPEAGAGLAVHVAPGDAAALADAVEAMVRDEPGRIALEALIAHSFAARDWSAIAEDIVTQARRLGENSAASITHGPPVAVAERFHWIGRSMAMCLRPATENGEGYRAGTGWAAPQDWGCRVAATGGHLAFRLPAALGLPGTLIEVAVRLVGHHAPCSYSVGGPSLLTGELAPGERLTVTWATTAPASGIVTVAIAGNARPENDSPSNGTVGVEGFAVHRRTSRREDGAEPRYPAF